MALGSPSTTVSMSSVNISSNQFRECLLNSDTNELNPTDAFILKMRRMWSYRSQAVGVTRPYNYYLAILTAIRPFTQSFRSSTQSFRSSTQPFRSSTQSFTTSRTCRANILPHTPWRRIAAYTYRLQEAWIWLDNIHHRRRQ